MGDGHCTFLDILEQLEIGRRITGQYLWTNEYR